MKEPISAIKARYLAMRTDGHWFDPDTMYFFRSRLSRLAEVRGCSALFVSSERFPDGTRRYTIRHMHWNTGEIDNVGEFGQYRTLSGAKRAIARMSH